jgi:hypothetical protein
VLVMLVLNELLVNGVGLDTFGAESIGGIRNGKAGATGVDVPS